MFLFAAHSTGWDTGWVNAQGETCNGLKQHRKKLKSYTEVDFSDSLRMKSAIILTIAPLNERPERRRWRRVEASKIKCFLPVCLVRNVNCFASFFSSFCLAVSSSRHILTETNNFYNLYREPQRRRAFIFSTLELTKKERFQWVDKQRTSPQAIGDTDWAAVLFAKHNTDIMYKKT